MAGVPLEVKIQVKDSSGSPGLGKASSAPGTKQQHSSHLRTSPDTHGDSSVVGFARSWQLLRVPGQPFTLESRSRKGVFPSPSAGEGFAPNPECLNELGTSWMQSLCGWEAHILYHILMSDPKWKVGKIKKPPWFPTMPLPLIREKTACTDPAPNPNSAETATFDWQPVLPHPQLPHLGKAAGPCQCPQELWGRAIPPKAGQCHTATRNDETSGITHCLLSR